MLPLATPASAAGTWTVTLGTPSGGTTTGFLANGTVTPDGNAGFAQIIYEPTGTPITSSSPTAGLVIYTAGVTMPQAVSLPVDQLTPNTSYTYELLATEDDNDAMFFSSPATFTTTAAPTGPGTPINPPNNPSANGIFGQCSGDPACVNDMNGVRAAQEQLAPLTLPTNWSTLTGAEQMFVWTNLERTSRGEVAITNLVNTYDAAVQTGLTNDADPSLSGLPGNAGSIWAGAFTTELGAMYGWLYDDGFGGENGDCTTPTSPGCWGHRDNILANANSFGNPTEIGTSAAASRKSPITVGLPHPSVGPSETASRPATSQPDMRSAPTVLMRPGVRMGFRHEQHGGDRGHHAENEGSPEEPVEVQVHDDRSSQDDPEADPDAEDRGEETDAADDAIPGELVPDDAEGQREDGATRARDDPAGQHDRQRGGEGADKSAQSQHNQDRHQHPLLAQHVAHPTQEWRADGGAEEIAGEQPRHGVGRRVQGVLQRGQRRDDQGLHDTERQRRHPEHGERHLIVRPLGSTVAANAALVPLGDPPVTTPWKRNPSFRYCAADPDDGRSRLGGGELPTPVRRWSYRK